MFSLETAAAVIRHIRGIRWPFFCAEPVSAERCTVTRQFSTDRAMRIVGTQSWRKNRLAGRHRSSIRCGLCESLLTVIDAETW